jgi:hypothetical protein
MLKRDMEAQKDLSRISRDEKPPGRINNRRKTNDLEDSNTETEKNNRKKENNFWRSQNP